MKLLFARCRKFRRLRMLFAGHSAQVIGPIIKVATRYLSIGKGFDDGLSQNVCVVLFLLQASDASRAPQQEEQVY